MRNRWLAPICILAMLAFSAAVYSRLPAIVPSHWGIDGQVDGTMSRTWGVLFTPALALLVWLLMLVLPRIDPRRDSYAAFAGTLQLFVNILMLFLALLHIGMLGVALGWNIPFPRIVIAGVGLLFAALGNELGRIKPNWFVGIRTPWTLADPEVWRRTHRAGGRLFVAIGLVFVLAGALLPFECTAAIVLAGVALILVFSFGYSYLAWRQLAKGAAGR